MKREIRDSVVIGFALFAMFFGAGNLIFPPHLGFLSGSKWFITLLSFALTGIGLPMLGIFAVGKSGGDIQSFAGKVHPVFADTLGTVIMLAIGPLLAMPRTAATTHEISIQPFLPSVSPIVTSVVFFGLVLLVSVFPSRVVGAVGKYITPFLILVLSAIIIRAFIEPVGVPVAYETENRFRAGFLEGYQTMDTLASILFATIVIRAIKSRGYKYETSIVRMNIAAGAIAGLGLLLVYGGLMYAGAYSGSVFEKDIVRTKLLIGICGKLWGTAGKSILALSMALACFTTAVGLAASAGQYFEKLFRGKVPYRVIVVIVCILSCVLANLGVEKIIKYSYPLLQALYPVCIFLTLINLLDRFVPNRFYYLGGTIGTLCVSVLDAVVSSQDLIGLDTTAISAFLQKLPLSQLGISWIVPAIVFAFAFGLIFRNKGKKE